MLYEYFLYFIFYAFLGWLMEVGVKLQELKRFVNRGFLIGPLCPIYGVGVLLIVILMGKPTSNFVLVFFKSILICSVLEYLTSYLMEKLFKARWWDYSKNKFNINGRICANTMIPFGILGTLVVYVLHPTVVKIIGKIPTKTQIILASILFIIFIVDNFISYFILNKIRKEIKNLEKDNTEEIKKHIMIWLEQNNVLYRRIKSAYPNFVIMYKQIKETIETTVEETQKVIKDNAIKTVNSTQKVLTETKKQIKERIDNYEKTNTNRKTRKKKD